MVPAPNRPWTVWILTVLALLSGMAPAMLSAVEPYGGLVQSDIAQEVYQRLARMVPGERPLEVYFYPDDDRHHPGYFPRIDMVLDGVAPWGLKIAEGNLALAGVEINLKRLFDDNRIELHSGRLEAGEIVIRERDLVRFLHESGALSKIKDLELRIQTNMIEVTGSFSLGIVSPRATLRGGFDVGDSGRVVLFVPTGLDAGIFGATPSTLQSLFDSINPVLDMRQVEQQNHLVGRVDRVLLTPGALVLRFR